MLKLNDPELIQINEIARKWSLHTETLRRWCVTGIKGSDGNRYRLEATRRGRKWFTTENALQEFNDKITRPKAPGTDRPGFDCIPWPTDNVANYLWEARNEQSN